MYRDKAARQGVRRFRQTASPQQIYGLCQAVKLSHQSIVGLVEGSEEKGKVGSHLDARCHSWLRPFRLQETPPVQLFLRVADQELHDTPWFLQGASPQRGLAAELGLRFALISTSSSISRT